MLTSSKKARSIPSGVNPETPFRLNFSPGLILPALLLALAPGATAQIVDIGGPLRPGEARPPLFLNLGPFTTSSSAAPYTPQQVRHAYGFDQLTADGAGQVIAIVDAYGSKNAQADLNTFCTQFGIASTTLVIRYPQGVPKAPNTSWAQETSLDVQWAHVIAPKATILLVVAKDAKTTSLLGAVDYAVNNGATVVSMSWGGGESSSDPSLNAHFSVPGVTFVASSGDNGEGVEWPASSPNVLAVGGTSLYLSDTPGTYKSETAWSGSGGGISAYQGLPSWQQNWRDQNNTQGGWNNTRGVPDVSYLADPNTGVYVCYNGRWYEFGGTSVGAPQWAGLIALANSARGSNLSGASSALYTLAAPSQPTPYTSVNATYFHDVLSGSNANDADDFAFSGYDLVTGVGSPVANTLVPGL